MTVKELIKLLEKCGPEKAVRFNHTTYDNSSSAAVRSVFEDIETVWLEDD